MSNFLRVLRLAVPRNRVTSLLSMSTVSQPSDLYVQHDEKNKEFYLLMNDKKAMLQYNLHGDVYDMYHTFVPVELRGAGVARVLADHAFEFVHKSDGKMKLTCSYLDHINKKNPDSKYSSLVVE